MIKPGNAYLSEVPTTVCRYYLDRLEENSNRYLASGTIPVDSQVLSLLEEPTHHQPTSKL